MPTLRELNERRNCKNKARLEARWLRIARPNKHKQAVIAPAQGQATQLHATSYTSCPRPSTVTHAPTCILAVPICSSTFVIYGRYGEITAMSSALTSPPSSKLFTTFTTTSTSLGFQKELPRFISSSASTFMKTMDSGCDA